MARCQDTFRFERQILYFPYPWKRADGWEVVIIYSAELRWQQNKDTMRNASLPRNWRHLG